MRVQYDGTSDTQIFDASDMAKAGIEDSGFKKTEFHRGVPTEVPDEVGQALISKEGLFGDYKFKEVNDDGEDDGTESASGDESSDGSDSSQDDGEAVSGTPAAVANPDSGPSPSRGTRTSRSTKGSTS